MPDRIFSESEVVDIVRRAAELQETSGSNGYVPGVTQEELRSIAAESGIEAGFLEQAINERLAGKVPPKGFRWREEFERVLDVEIAPDSFDVVTDQIKARPVTHVRGVSSGGVSQVGRSIQGQAAGKWDNPYFKVTSRGGRTKIEVQSSGQYAFALGALWFTPLVMSPMVGLIGGNPVLGILSALSSVVGAFLSCKWMARKGNETARDVAKSLENAVLAVASEQPQATSRRVDSVDEQAELKLGD